jgi:hypothetical protein
MLATAQQVQHAAQLHPQQTAQQAASSDLQDPRKLIHSMIENLNSQQDLLDLEQIKSQQATIKQQRTRRISETRDEIECIVDNQHSKH